MLFSTFYKQVFKTILSHAYVFSTFHCYSKQNLVQTTPLSSFSNTTGSNEWVNSKAPAESDFAVLQQKPFKNHF